MPSTGIFRNRNCIHITVILHFHKKLMSYLICYPKNFRTKTGKSGPYNYRTSS